MNQTATHAAAAKVAKPKKTAKISHAKQTPLTLPTADAPEFGIMAMDRIRVLDQVRTEFDDDSLRELAADIAHRGILQPLTVRPDGDGFVLVAGERRLRAAQLACLDSVPVIICQMSADEHHAAQLAENIQREDLSTLEEARAIRRLFDMGKSATEVAEFVHKSKSWVSKRLAVSAGNLAWQATQLLEDGTTEDLELILGVDALAKLDYYEAQLIAKAIRAGNAGRETVRQKLAEVKEREAQREAERAERDAQWNSPEAIAKREAETAERKRQWEAENERQRQLMHRNPARLMARFLDWCAENPDEGGDAWLNKLDKDQVNALNDHFDDWHAAGSGMNALDLAIRLLFETIKNNHADYGRKDLPTEHDLAALTHAVMSPSPAFVLSLFLDWYKGKLINRAQQELAE